MTILFRRAVALGLGVVFIVLAVAAFLVYHANSTLLDPNFYVEQVREADAFTYLYDEAGPLAIQEIETENPDLDIPLTDVSGRIIASVRETLPPDWLDEQVEEGLNEILPYVTGDSDTFTVSIQLGERLRGAGPILKDAIRDEEVMALLYEDALSRGIDEALVREGQLPFDLAFTNRELQDSFRRIAPPEWLTAQFDTAVDAFIPYVVGDTDEFTIVIPLGDRAEVAAEELKRLLAGKDLSGYVIDQAALPQLIDSLGDGVVVPFNLRVTGEHVEAVVQDVLEPAWVQARVEELIDALAAYMTGASERFVLEVPLESRKAVLEASVGRLMEEELRAAYVAAPACTREQLASLDYSALVTDGIQCQAPGVSVDQLQVLAGLVDFQRQVGRLVGAVAPDSWTLTDEDLRRTLGRDQFEVVERLRGWVIDGLVYTEADLDELITRVEYPSTALAWSRLSEAQRAQAIADSDAVRRFHDFRADLRDGFTFTQADLQEWIDEGGEGTDEVSAFIDSGRGWLHQGRQWRLLGVVALALILGTIGVMGGRRPATKVAWAASFLIAASLIAFVAAGPVWSSYAGDEISQAMSEVRIDGLSEDSPLQTALLDKGQAMAENASDDFASGLASRALLFLALGLAGLAGSMTWLWVRRRVTRNATSGYDALSGAPN